MKVVKQIRFDHLWKDGELYIRAKDVLKVLKFYMEFKDDVIPDLKNFHNVIKGIKDPLKGIWK